MREVVESGEAAVKDVRGGTGTGRQWMESLLGSGGDCKMPAAARCGGGWGSVTRTRGRCRGRAQFAKRCWGFSAPPALVFFLLPDPLPPLASENC